MNKQKSGFTIVEIVIALSVMAILASIAFVGYGNYRQKVDTDRNKFLAEQIGQEIEAYKIAYGKKPTTLGIADADSLYANLSDELKTRLSNGEVSMPSETNPKNLKLKICTSISDPTIVNGYEVYYFDTVNLSEQKTTFGIASGSDTICN